MSQIFRPTLKEVPADAVIDSHKLMIRSGMIRRLSSGLYSYLPLGLRVFRKVEEIIRHEMNSAGAQEFSLPILTPSELWKKTGRWEIFGKELIRIKDRNNHWNALGPTHEEVFTEIVRTEITSYKQLPVNFYQIKTKFRDEIRPRFGVMRCREFTMKDAYSFDIDKNGLEESYNKMRKAYQNIFKRCGLDTAIVQADTGAMGGTRSEEFMVVSEIGEETLVICQKCWYSANLEKAESKESKEYQKEDMKELREVDTPDKKSIKELMEFFKAPPEKFIKTIIYMADENPVMVLIRGDLEINETKLKNLLKVTDLELADDNTIKKTTKADVGFAGPVGIKNIHVYADFSIKSISNAITGANKTDKHIINVNLDKDFQVKTFSDIRTVKQGDLCLQCNSKLIFKKGIEVGHIFKLGYKYTENLDVKFLDKDHKEKHPIMGCYGIGVDRTIAAIIEQSHDKDGIIWPITTAPFEISIIPIVRDNKKYMDYAFSLYKDLKNDYNVILDDRKFSPGYKFKDADLIGIPVKVILSEKNLSYDKVEIKLRNTGKSVLVDKNKVLSEIKKIIKEEYKNYEV